MRQAMKLLLDTCALLWLGSDPDSLSPRAKEALVQSPDQIHVSAISALEIAIKVAKGRLVLPAPPESWYPRVLQTYQLREVPVSGTIALRAPRVALVQADPADRIVVSTALELGLAVITADHHIRASTEVSVIW